MKASPSLTLPLILGLFLPTAAASEKVAGYAEYRNGEFLIVDGQRIGANKKTLIEGPSHKSSVFETIPLGYEVIVKGNRREDGSVRAKRIQVRSNGESSTEKELKESFDKIETEYRKQGSMRITDSKGKVVEDYGKLLEDGPQVERVRSITGRLIPSYLSGADVRVYVVENKEWNAMAAPNFSIYVFSGLLADLGDDEVAIVLGHEIAHATHEHSRRQYQRNSWIALGATAASEIAGGGLAETSLGLATMALVNGYSRNHEDQADRVGLRYTYEAGYDVRTGPRLWKRFAEKYGDTNVAVNFFLGDHSRSKKRAELLELEIERNYSQRAAPGQD